MAKLSIKHLSSLLVLLLSVCVLSCIEGNNDVDWTEEKVVEVSSEMVPISIFGDPGVVDGMRVRIQGESQWSAFPIHFIEGFEFEPGYSYTLKVEITHLANPPQDSYDVAYKLIELISKTEVWARKKAAGIILSDYVVLEGTQYKLDISEQDAQKLGVSPHFYKMITKEISHTNATIQKMLENGDSIELCDIQAVSKTYKNGTFSR